jgi:hypothetical protein
MSVGYSKNIALRPGKKLRKQEAVGAARCRSNRSPGETVLITTQSLAFVSAAWFTNHIVPVTLVIVIITIIMSSPPNAECNVAGGFECHFGSHIGDT